MTGDILDDVETIRSITLASLSLQQPSNADRAAWDERLRRVLRCQALGRADLIFGRYGKAEERLGIARIHLEGKYGKGYRPRNDGEAEENELWREYDAAFLALESASEARQQLVQRPYDEAIKALVLTPAPDVFAARFKVELIAEEGLADDWLGPDGELMQIVADDLSRLVGEEIA